MIGWFDDIDDANAYIETNQFNFPAEWEGMTNDQKTRALNQSHQTIKYTPGVTVPNTLTPDQLDCLKLVQSTYAGHIVVLGSGGQLREAVMGQGVRSAGIVDETYSETASALPARMIELLKSAGIYKAKSFYGVGSAQVAGGDIP